MQLKKAGLAGSMDELRARAYLDLLLDKDSRPSPRGKDSRPAPAPASGGKGSAGGKPGGSGEPGGSGKTGATSGSGGDAGTDGPGPAGQGPRIRADPAAPRTPQRWCGLRGSWGGCT